MTNSLVYGVFMYDIIYSSVNHIVYTEY